MYVCFCFRVQWGKSAFPVTVRAEALPSVPCLIYMHGWHCISIVIAVEKKCRELTGDIWQLILRAQLQAFACILLYSGAFSSHSPLLCSAQWAYLQTVSLFRAGVCSLSLSVCVCASKRVRDGWMGGGVGVDLLCTNEDRDRDSQNPLQCLASAALPAGWRNVNKLSIF